MKLRFDRYTLCILCLGLFAFMRIYRNSLNYYSTQKGGIWNVVVLVYLLIAMLYLSRKPGITKAARMGLAYTVLSMCNVLIVQNNTLSLAFLYNYVTIGIFVYVLIAFYFVEYYSEDTSSSERVTILVFFAVSILSFISTLWYKTGNLDFVMISNVYYAECLLPLLLHKCKNRAICFAGYLIVGAGLLFSGKRAGFVAFVLFVFIVAVLEDLFRKNYRRFFRNLFLLILIIVALSLSYDLLVSRYNLDLFKRLVNLKNDEGSGRGTMYRQLWDAIKRSGIRIIFGHGYAKTGEVMIVHDTAHCDFLEIFYDYGLLPIISFCLFYVRLFNESIRMIRSKFSEGFLFLGTVVMSLVFSAISTYCITYGYCVCGMACIGAISGKYRKYMDCRYGFKT